MDYYKGYIDEKTGNITYIALPYPLPPEWRARIMQSVGNAEALERVEREARDAIGIVVSRPVAWKGR